MFQKIQNLIEKLKEKGQGVVEYALVLGFVAVIAVYLIGSADLKTNVVDKGTNNAKSAAQGMENAFTAAKGSANVNASG